MHVYIIHKNFNCLCYFLGQNNIIYTPGAVMHLMPTDILAAEEMIKNTKIMLCTYECPLDTLVSALTVAKKYNGLFLLNYLCRHCFNIYLVIISFNCAKY